MPTTQDSLDATASSVHLDAIRGAAAVIVLLGHTRDLFFSSISGRPEEDRPQVTTTGQPAPPDVAQLNARITIGNEAVMIFFVLSGYLVGGSAIKAFRRNRWSWKDYAIKRMTRLWVVLLPALFFGVLLDRVGVHFFNSPASIYSAPPHQTIMVADILGRLTARVIAGNVVFVQSILLPPAGSNDSLWSLANEFWYYLAFPLLLLMFWPARALWQRVAALAAFVAVGWLVAPAAGALFFIWMLGALLSVIPLRLPRETAKKIGAVMAILLPFLLFAVRRAAMPLRVAQWVVALFFVTMLYMVLHQTAPARNGVYRRVASFFSRISYTLYLVHLPLAVLLCAAINDPWHIWKKTPANLALYLAFNAFLVFFAWLFYLAFEANTDRVRLALFHRDTPERHLPTSTQDPDPKLPQVS